MPDLSKKHHLINRNGRWYYHRRVPLALRTQLGPVIRKALGTSNLKEAIKLRELEDVVWSTRLSALEQPDAARAGGELPAGVPSETDQPMNEHLAMQVVRDYVERTDRHRSKQWMTQPCLTRDQRRAAVENAEHALAIAHGRAADYDHEGFISEMMDEISSSAGLVVEGEEANGVFYGLVKRAIVEVFRRALARSQDDHSQVYFDQLFNPDAPRDITVRELVSQFLAYEEEQASARGLTTKHVDKVRASVRLIETLLGPETSVRETDFDRCQRVRSLLNQLPPNFARLYPNLPITKVIERSRADGRAPLGPITQRQYLATLKQLLELAVSKGLLRSNPAASLQPLAPDTLSARDKRVPFEPEQLQAFFSSTFYADCALHPEMPFLRAEKDWRFWLPLLCLFMGMRPREVCQLHTGDLKQTAKGIWFVDVAPAVDIQGNASKSTKTKASRRSIPLHVELRRLGFVEFVTALAGMSTDARVFRTLTRNKYGDPAQYPLKRFNESFLPEAIALRPRQAFYSFRHTWRDATRAINAPDDFLQAVGGWNKGMTTSDAYGSLRDIDRYAGFMDRLAFAGLDLSHLHMKGSATANVLA